MSDTKKCPFCAEEIKAEAVVCKHCGRNLESGTAGTQAEKKPWIGFAGLALMAIGLAVVFCGGGSTVGIWMTIAGAGVLGYALVTGNIKMFGN